MRRNILLFALFYLIIGLHSCKQEADKVNVLINLPLTGDGATYASLLKNGVEIGLEQIDEQTRNKLNVIFQDDKLSTKEAVNILHQEMAMQRLSAVMTTSTEMAMTLAPICNSNKIVLLPPIADGDEITKDKEYVFLITPTSSFQGTVLADKIIEYGYKTAAIFYLNDAWGKSLSTEFSEKFSDLGGSIVSSESCEAGQTDMRSTLLRIKNNHPEVILLILHPTETIPTLKQIRELGITAALFGGDTFSNKDLYKSNTTQLVQGIRFTLPTQPTDSIYKEFERLFISRYGYKPDVNAAAARDAIALIAKAVKEGATSGSSIKDFFCSHSTGFEGSTGLIKWDKNRNVVSKKYSLYIIKGDKYELDEGQ
jgi:branched-chain amino acid transport system substrate-binding protein